MCIRDSLNPLLYNNLPYQASDFKQLGSMGKSPMLLIVHPALGVKNVQEFICLLYTSRCV